MKHPAPARALEFTLALALSATTALLATAPAVRGQAVTNPNQIVGDFRLDTTTPEILDALRDPPGLGEGLVPNDTRRRLTATSVGVVPQLSHHTRPQVALPGRDRANYDLTVESSVTGIPYSVEGVVYLDSGLDEYVVSPQLSGPVLPDPAPDVVLDLVECAGMIEINWITDTGLPFFVDGGYVHADRQTAPGSGAFVRQAEVDDIGAIQDRERLIVHGGADFNLTIRAYLVYGSDPEFDLGHIEHICDQSVHVDCDEVERITCVIPTGGPGPIGCEPFGRIEGIIDMLGEIEVHMGGARLGARTMTRSFDGPQGNERWFSLRFDPSSGLFRHENLLAPPGGGSWRFESAMGFGTGYGAELFTPPQLGLGLNPRVPVTACVTTDLADTFVMDPGHVVGDIFLAGPRRTVGGRLFEDLRRDLDGNIGPPWQWPFLESVVGGFGRNALAPGATHSAAGGEAHVGFNGGETQNQRNFEGDYDLRLAGLDAASSVWNPHLLRVAVRDRVLPSDPPTYRDSSVSIFDNTIGDRQIDPGATITIDRDYCFSQVILAYESTSGIFFKPRLDATGTFVGTDYRGEPADQAFSLHAEGTPVNSASAAATGLVTMALPEGTYDVTPHVTSVSPRGIESETELPPLSFTAGCRQVIQLVRELIPYMAGLPECTPDPVATITGGFQSADDVVSITYRLNGGAPTTVCTACGNSPSFSFDVAWLPCENELTVEAEDSEGRHASITASTSLDAEPPRVDADAFSVWPPNHQYLCFTNVLDAVRATDNCPGPLRYELTSCKSDQPDDAQGPRDTGVDGDGHTSDDCVLADDRSGFCLRAERLGNCPEGRTYSVTVHVTDDCGLSTDAAVRFLVPREAPDRASPPAATPTFELGPRDAIPFAFTRPADPDAGLPTPFGCGG